MNLFLSKLCSPQQSGVERFFCPINCFCKVEFGFVIQFWLKCPFLTVFIKIYCPTKLDVGTWEVSILFRNSRRFLLLFILEYPKMTPYVPKIAAKLTSSYQAISTNWPATKWQLLKHVVEPCVPACYYCNSKYRLENRVQSGN